MRGRITIVGLALALLPAAPAAARPVPHGFMGVVAGAQLLEHPSRIPGEFRAMRRAGVQSVKAEFVWRRIEPAKGTYDWSVTDAVVRTAAREGFSVLPTVLQAPDWATGPEDAGQAIRHSQDPDDYGRFLITLVRRYGPQGTFWATHPHLHKLPVRAWEIWNEPELYHWWKPPWLDPYVQLLKSAHHAVKAADPHAKIVLAGLTFESWKDLRRLYAHGARRYFDVVSLHPYTHFPANVIKTVAYVRRVMRRHHDPRKPIWITELAWTSGKGRTANVKSQPNFLNSTPKGQATLLRRAYLALARDRMRYNVRRVYWYTWLTRDRSRRDPFDYSGLRFIRKGHVHSKPALTAFARVARRLEARR